MNQIRLIHLRLLLLLLIVICNPRFSLSQNANEIMSNSIRVQAEGYSDFDKEKLKTIEEILKLNVFAYFNLSDYDTELKKKTFKNTIEYKNYLSELRLIKDSILKQTFYCEVWIPDAVFNLKSKSFSFTTQGYKDDLYNPQYIQFENICIAKPSGMTIQNKMISEINRQYVFFKVNNEQLALNMENNGVRLLFLFKFQNTRTYTYIFGGSFKVTSTHLLTSLSKVIAFNPSDGEIYLEYKPIPIQKK